MLNLKLMPIWVVWRYEVVKGKRQKFFIVQKLEIAADATLRTPIAGVIIKKQ